MASKQASNVLSGEQLGYHKGALTTLLKEREELARLITIVEQLIRMHTSALKELGVDLEKDVSKKPKKPIEDILK